MGIPDDAVNMEICRIFCKDEVFYVYQTDNVVRILFVDRKSGIHGLPKYGKHLFIAVLHINGDHVDTGNHNILGNCIGKIKYIVDELPLLGLDHTILVAYIHIGL